jgi:hypothetical protein
VRNDHRFSQTEAISGPRGTATLEAQGSEIWYGMGVSLAFSDGTRRSFEGNVVAGIRTDAPPDAGAPAPDPAPATAPAN